MLCQCNLLTFKTIIIKLIKFLSEYVGSVNGEVFRTNPKAPMENGKKIKYEDLKPSEKTRVLYSYLLMNRSQCTE